jgi:hypothetical protein
VLNFVNKSIAVPMVTECLDKSLELFTACTDGEKFRVAKKDQKIHTLNEEHKRDENRNSGKHAPLTEGDKTLIAEITQVDRAMYVMFVDMLRWKLSL